MTDICVDTECYKNYWLCMFENGHDVELFDGQAYVDQVPVPRAVFNHCLAHQLRGGTMVTFNGTGYDMPIITLALEGASTEQLKAASDAMIVQGVKHWDIARPPDWIDHIDMMEVAPGAGGLKSYAARMHSRRLQDLPIEPGAIIGPAERLQLREYCRWGDIAATRDLLDTFPKQLALRRDMGAEYGLDLRSKSDAQIAETVMRVLLPFKVEKPGIAYGRHFHYRPPEWLRFERLDVLQLLERSPFTISDSGTPLMTEELKNTRVTIGRMAYQMGSGGLHSTESEVLYDSDLIIADVASYYPSLIKRLGIYPAQIGPSFQQIYSGWYDRRMTAKRSGDTKTANSLKTLLNGTFGKLGSPWSIFYAPAEMIQVTLTGQLALLMLIEALELRAVQVVSANTDGIVLRAPAHQRELARQIIAWWEGITGMVMELEDWQLLAARDVNSYVAIDGKGAPKRKGEFADPVPGASGWPNPNRQICIDALTTYLRDGTDIRQTIHACRDIRQFLSVRQVKGGGWFCPNGSLPRKAGSLKFMRSVVGDIADKQALTEAYSAAVAANEAERRYLGKTVRWYHSADRRGCIVTPTGGQVAGASGVRDLMQLPDEFPDDVDYDWYIGETISLMRWVGA